jgi:hypothetical protein
MTDAATTTQQVVVAGTAGGVGTTTVTALLFAALSSGNRGAPQLLDHSAGELGLRLPEGDDVPRLDPHLALHDLGAHAGTGVDRLTDPRIVLVVVAAATPAGCEAADRLLDAVVAEHGRSALRRVLVVAVGVFGRHRIGPTLRSLGERVGSRSVVLIPPDLSLAAGGRVPLVRLTTHTVRGQRQIASVLQDRLRSLPA